MVTRADSHPERQLIAKIVSVVKKTAVLHQQAARVDARPSAEPADRHFAGDDRPLLLSEF
jgi:hypothetical protein